MLPNIVIEADRYAPDEDFLAAQRLAGRGKDLTGGLADDGATPALIARPEKTEIIISHKNHGLKTLNTDAYVRKTDIINAMIIYSHEKDTPSKLIDPWYAEELRHTKDANDFAV